MHIYFRTIFTIRSYFYNLRLLQTSYCYLPPMTFSLNPAASSPSKQCFIAMVKVVSFVSFARSTRNRRCRIAYPAQRSTTPQRHGVRPKLKAPGQRPSTPWLCFTGIIFFPRHQPWEHFSFPTYKPGPMIFH